VRPDVKRKTHSCACGIESVTAGLDEIYMLLARPSFLPFPVIDDVMKEAGGGGGERKNIRA
jgi:hypothetical protein